MLWFRKRNHRARAKHDTGGKLKSPVAPVNNTESIKCTQKSCSYYLMQTREVKLINFKGTYALDCCQTNNKGNALINPLIRICVSRSSPMVARNSFFWRANCASFRETLTPKDNRNLTKISPQKVSRL